MLKILFVCGMSGAGKTTTQNTLEDLGYMCIDNIPPSFISLVVDLMQKQNEKQQICFIFDIKYHSLKLLVESYEQMKDRAKEEQFALEIVFLDAQDEQLLSRYRETRRKHPLASSHVTLAEGIQKERLLLSKLKERSNVVIDTTALTVKDLIVRIDALFGEGSTDNSYTVMFRSFGFKHSIPVDVDFLVDVRFLKNPFYDEQLRIQTGQHNEVKAYVLENSEGKQFLTETITYLTYLLAKYQTDKRNQFVVAIGCTGGQHRSVAITEALYEHFKEHYICFVQHRDMEKNQVELLKRYHLM